LELDSIGNNRFTADVHYALWEVKSKVKDFQYKVLQIPKILCFSFRTDEDEFNPVRAFQKAAQERTDSGKISS
jgi:hypothetical protein